MKSVLRVKYKDMIAELSESQRKAQSVLITQRLTEFLKNKKGMWTLFCPLNDEPNLLELMETSAHIDWVFPRVESKTHMSFRRAQSKDQMICSSWGLEEPSAEQSPAVNFDEISGCIIPGLGFDSHGVRLGRGGGYYDRFLQSFSGLRVGVIFNEGIANEPLPKEGHDQLMDIVVTPREWIKVS